ncbi:MAG: stage II sporulation protein D [Clostridia bacterium]|nr:stage II sporulation protein D [Clostridia bacterium]
MNYRIDFKKLIPLLLALAAVVLLVRGCFAARSLSPDALVPDDYDQRAVRVDMRLELSDGTVRTIDLEDYIVGVVAGEMPASFELEALKAQAVAARTYAAQRLESLGGSPCSQHCDLCSDSGCCQAYRTDSQLRASWDDYAAKLAKVRLAVSSTAGLIATYDSMPIDALYHSSSGGRTEYSQNVFAAALPYLVSVDSPDLGANDGTDERVFSEEEFAAALNAAFPAAALTPDELETQVEIVSRFDSGRVEQIRIGGTAITGRQFRAALELNSANFTLEISGAKVLVRTVGFGHGVGMSQYGANAMAAAGHSYDEILRHYYTGIALESIYAGS